MNIPDATIMMIAAVGIAASFAFARRAAAKRSSPIKREDRVTIYNTPFHRNTHPEDMRPTNDKAESAMRITALTGVTWMDIRLVYLAYWLLCTSATTYPIEVGATIVARDEARVSVVFRSTTKEDVFRQYCRMMPDAAGVEPDFWASIIGEMMHYDMDIESDPFTQEHAMMFPALRDMVQKQNGCYDEHVQKYAVDQYSDEVRAGNIKPDSDAFSPDIWSKHAAKTLRDYMDRSTLRNILKG